MWLIVRTDARKESFVARQITIMGYDAYVPCQIIAARPAAARRVTAKAHLQTIRELPILPRRVFAAVPEWLQDEIAGIRHLIGIERDVGMSPIAIPDSQIAAFRAEIDRENTAALALASRPSRKQKAKWRSLHDALLDMIEQAKSRLEQAA